MKTLICIVGPTASGKTALGIELANYFNTEIISADSRQFFKEMEIGTAKPSVHELSQAIHHFVNNKSIAENYDAGQFELDALKVIEEIFKNKDIAILCGGSGLYIKAVCEGFDEMPIISEEIRSRLNEEFEKEGIAGLLEKLQNCDPEYFDKVDKNNPQRVIRALEVFESSGVPYSSFRTAKAKPRDFKVLKIGLEWPREELYDRINVRMDSMLENGLLDEVKSLIPFKHKNALQTVGYSEIFDFLDGKSDWAETVRLLKQNSRRYAKRQMTWFKRDTETQWFHPSQKDQIIAFLEEKLQL